MTPDLDMLLEMGFEKVRAELAISKTGERKMSNSPRAKIKD